MDKGNECMPFSDFKAENRLGELAPVRYQCIE
jgi:hypothetical protein